ncbi:enoyl-CoA hydratase/isomerase family protein [Streptomyces sp. NPDC001315]|uniref:enoyl-CoA hydratase/isomerase family protein n=1 Tax=Streptomyces sp. NPDC001315 TaxID=3364562 RepID=UPI0036B92863
MTDSRVQIRYAGDVAELVLSSPGRSNALDLDTAEQLRSATAEVAVGSGLRAVLLRAEGKNFCVGGDLRSFAAHGDDLGGYVKAVADAAHAARENLHRLPVPVICAVQGAVAGAGVGLALAGDIILVARSTRIRLAYTAVGLSPDNGASWTLPRLLGPRRALELALTNRVVSAEDAVAWGLASEVVEDTGLVDRAREVARDLGTVPLAALIATKRLFLESAAGRTLSAQLARESEMISSLAGSPQARDAIERFLHR